MLERCEGLAGHWIHMLPFSFCCFTKWGSGNDGFTIVNTGLQRPTSVWPKRSKSRLRAMRRVVLTKLQSLLSLAKIEL
jgi:hypothetical protein